MSNDNITAIFEEAVTAMTLPENRFDVTIICTTDDHQAEFWMSKLSVGLQKSSSDSNFPMVLAVSEDWLNSSGAGNGLGTLYAWTKAAAYAKEKYNGVDLSKLLLDGSISAALYHTAGKGTRMAPLPASENNNKPGVVRFDSPTMREREKKRVSLLGCIGRHNRHSESNKPKRYQPTPFSVFFYRLLRALEITLCPMDLWRSIDCVGGGRPTNWYLCSLPKGTIKRLLG